MMFGFCGARLAFSVSDLYLSRAANTLCVRRHTYYAEYQVHVYATNACRQQSIHLRRRAQFSKVQRV